ncbi:MAG: hypothetical protein ACKVZ6_09220 [Kineosporiaceae bacterium]
MTSVELHVPSDVLAALREEPGPARPTESVTLTVSIDGLDVVTGVSSTSDLKDQLPTLAQAICLCVFRRPPTATTRLVVEGPGLETRVTLPPDVSPHQVLTTLAGLVDTVERVEKAGRTPPLPAPALAPQVRRASSDPGIVVRTPAPRPSHGN